MSMFCPKCGCMIPDGAKVCTECGHRIRRCEADALKQEQPAKWEARASMTGYATGKDALLVLTCIVSAMLALSFFLEWLGPAGITGLDVVLDQPDMGRGSLAVCAMPLFVAVLGVFCAVLSMAGECLRFYIMPLCAIVLGTTVMFGVRAQEMGYDIGLGTCLALFCGGCLLILALHDRADRRNR